MANQMIALQARAPQAAGLGSAIAQNAQMINMLSQQRAAERQAALAQQELAASQRKEKRDVAAADVDLAGKQIDYHYKRATAVNTPQGYQAWLAGVAKDSPEFAEFFVTNLPPEAFDRDALIRMVGSVKDNFDATYGPVTTELAVGAKGQPLIVSRGGFTAPTVVSPRFLIPGPQTSIAPRAGQAEVGAPTFTDGGVGGPDMGAAPVGDGDMAGIASILSNVRDDTEYQTVLNAIDMQNPQVAASIRQAMPRFDPQRMAGIRAANAQTFGGAGMADQGGLVAGERGGVGGPYEGYVEAPQPFQLRVPAAPSAPQPRETAEEVGRKEAARLEAQRIAKLKAGPTPATPTEQRVRRAKLAKDYSTAQGIIDNTFDPVSGIVAAVNTVRKLSRPQKNAILGYTGKFPTLTSSTKAADTAIENLRGIVTALGRQAAAAAGAVGPMAVQEWKILADQVASLDLVKMEPEDLDRQMNIIEQRAKNAARLMSDTYQKQYGEDIKEMPEFKLNIPGATSTARKAAPNLPVLTPEQARKAPKGTRYRTTDGRTLER